MIGFWVAQRWALETIFKCLFKYHHQICQASWIWSNRFREAHSDYCDCFILFNKTWTTATDGCLNVYHLHFVWIWNSTYTWEQTNQENLIHRDEVFHFICRSVYSSMKKLSSIFESPFCHWTKARTLHNCTQCFSLIIVSARYSLYLPNVSTSFYSFRKVQCKSSMDNRIVNSSSSLDI